MKFTPSDLISDLKSGNKSAIGHLGLLNHGFPVLYTSQPIEKAS